MQAAAANLPHQQPEWLLTMFQEVKRADSTSLEKQHLDDSRATSLVMIPAPSTGIENSMVLCLRDHNKRSFAYPHAYSEFNFAIKKPELKTAWELHWGQSRVPSGGHHATPDFSRFFFCGVPVAEAKKLLLFCMECSLF